MGHRQKEKNNGILILVALNDRKIDIEVGYGLEDRVTDGLAKRVIENDIKPAFKQKNYYQGLDTATNTLIDMVAGRYKAEAKNDKGLPTPLIIFLVIMGIIILISIFGKNSGMGSSGGSGGGMGPIFWGGMGGGGSSWGGGGGGGSSFGGFGGGSFGGGGASGDW
ncbi:MAG: TPM domain-containing protein [Sphingobacteriales bacterium JAD_PAG50586_3]|nr:MAG: TPM domain-containing protein [Sphingobacteriales bacterium JAD_PAG50586_3]